MSMPPKSNNYVYGIFFSIFAIIIFIFVYIKATKPFDTLPINMTPVPVVSREVPALEDCRVDQVAISQDGTKYCICREVLKPLNGLMVCREGK